MIEQSGTYLRKTDGHYEGLGIQYRQGRAESVARRTARSRSPAARRSPTTAC